MAGEQCASGTHCPTKDSSGRTRTKGGQSTFSENVAHLMLALQEVACHKCPQDDADSFAILRQTITLRSKSLQALHSDMVTTVEVACQKVLLLEATIDELRVELRTSQEEAKRVAQELKHSQNERLRANERARTAEEKMAKVVEQGERDRREALLEKQRAQQLQKRVDNFVQCSKMQPSCECHCDSKSKKAKDSAPDVAGLQRGLDKAKAQLKKKQDDFQAQAQILQQTTARFKNLELKFTEEQQSAERLQGRVTQLSSQMEGGRVQMNSERLAMGREIEKRDLLLNMARDRYQAATAEIGRLSRLLESAEVRSSRLVEQINRLEEQLNPTSYEPFGVSSVFLLSWCLLELTIAQDANIADRIRIRNLVDQVQERLAMKAGLTPSGPGELLSLTWRVALGPGVDDTSRVQRAKELLAGKELDQRDRVFLADEEALRHVCQHYSRFRKPGNDLHQLLTREGYMASIRRFLRINPSEDKGHALFAMADYVCPR